MGLPMKIINWLVIHGLSLAPESVIWHFAKRYIAGPTLDDAVRVVRYYNSKGVKATVDWLGEEIRDVGETHNVVQEYKKALNAIHEFGLDASISVKPTHLGLLLDQEVCYHNARKLVHEATIRHHNFVRLDMEDSSTTFKNFKLYLRLKEEFGGEHVGAAIQSYLRRSLADAENLSLHQPNLRLCKGIYKEPKDIAFQRMSNINRNYDNILEILLKNRCYVGIAGHDPERIAHALHLIDKYDAKDYCIFEMLLGVAEDTCLALAEKGYKTLIYVPYGRDWRPFSIRRFKENPKMLEYVIRDILKSVIKRK